MTTETVRTVRSLDGTVIATQRTGPPDGPVVVMVDPALGSSGFRQSAGLADLLAQEFTVVTYDRRGRGASTDTRPYAVAREVEDLAAVIEAAGGPAHVYALSSGGLLALQAAAAGVSMAKLAVFEPPLQIDEEGHQPAEPDALTAELAELIAQGRNGDAVERFHVAIGVPPEMVGGLRDSPMWPAFEAAAPTLVYDCTLGDKTDLGVIARVPVPTLVLDSEGSTENLTGWAAAIVGALPRGSHRSLAGEWHSVPDADLAAAVGEFFRA
jgi:pimeloyl-ACP methyl ester carboxylesterase